MKINKNHVLIAAVVLPVLFAIGQASTPSEQATRVLRRYSEALSAKDMQAIGKLVVPDESLSVFEYIAPPFTPDWGWDAYRERHLSPEFQVAKTISFVMDDLKVHSGSDLAYATFVYRVRILGQLEGKPPATIAGHGIGTAVLVKRSGEWRIQHLHTTSLEMKKVG
jgi:ketosteroid isomerase-like protein